MPVRGYFVDFASSTLIFCFGPRLPKSLLQKEGRAGFAFSSGLSALGAAAFCTDGFAAAGFATTGRGRGAAFAAFATFAFFAGPLEAVLTSAFAVDFFEPFSSF